VSLRKSHAMILMSLGLLVILVISGCGAGKTMVVKPPETAARFSAAEISAAQSTVNVPQEIQDSFQTKLAKLLYEEGGFTRGPGLTIRYRFIQYNPGSQFTRWFWGGIGNAGEGTMTVEATFLNGDQELAKIQSEGKIGSGAFGGSFDFAVQKAAGEVAEYAKRFRGVP
jgi:hypothetical protein